MAQTPNGSTGPRPHLGVTEPVSLAGPSERHKQITETMIAELRANNVFESAADARLREVVLGKLNAIVKDFVYRVSLKRGFHEVQAREAGGKIFTFGSYRLGVHGPGADIDTLAVVPRHVTRKDFFEILEPTLKARSDVEECIGVPNAWVPVIKMQMSGVDIDLLCASIATLPTVSDDLDLQNNDLLKGLDEEDMRSVNGSRVTDQILSLVPDVPVFREALRTIKLWAKRRAIYSNIVGFFGGVVWAMLVARICQLFPNECAGGIISRFFVILHRWDWPTPIMLKRIEEGPLHVKLWNPSIYSGDKAHRMPVITPAYPSMCATHNVSMSTQSIMIEEFKRAADIVDKIVVRSAAWSELFAPHEFFQQYRYYLQITASSIDLDVQLKWSGTVQSKIRSLIKNLEFNEQLEMAHPFVDGFERQNICESTDEMHLVMTGELPRHIYDRKEEDYKDKPETTRVYTTSFFIGLLVRPQDPVSGANRQLNISYPTQEFTKITKTWDGFDEAKMGIVVRYVKAANLPPYVPSVKKAPKTKNLKRQKEDKAAAAELRQQLPFDSHKDAADGLAGASPAKRIRASSSALESASGAALTPSASMSSLIGTPAPDTPQTESATRQLQSLTTEGSPLDAAGARDTPPVAIAAGSVPGATSLPSTAALKQAAGTKPSAAAAKANGHLNGIPGLTQPLVPSAQSAGADGNAAQALLGGHDTSTLRVLSDPAGRDLPFIQ